MVLLPVAAKRERSRLSLRHLVLRFLCFNMPFLENLDKSIQDGPVGRFFEMKERKTTVRTELRGALATFMSLSYILAVNPAILSESGGNCVADEDGIMGPAYSACVEGLRREYITATAIASMLGCFFMGAS